MSTSRDLTTASTVNEEIQVVPTEPEMIQPAEPNVDEDATENSDLVIKPETTTSWWEWGKQKLNQVTPSFLRAKTPPADEPLQPVSWASWAKNFALNSGAFIAALPNFINSTMAADNAPAKAFVSLDWWRNLPTGKLLYTIANGASSLVVNLLLNLFFFPIAVAKFYHDVTHFKEDPVRKFIAILFGIAGAVGAGAIAYDAFQFFPGTFYGELIAGTMAGANLFAYVALRYMGAAGVLEKFFNLFDKDFQTQLAFVDLLDHIKPEYRNDVNNMYQRVSTPILKQYPAKKTVDQADIERLTTDLAEALSDYEKMHPDLFTDKTALEKFLRGLGIFFDLSLALGLVLCPITLTFMQAGFNGISQIGKFASNDDLSYLDDWYKRAIGILPGLASGALYTLSNIEVRSTLNQNVQDLYQAPSTSGIAMFLMLLAANVLSTSSVQNFSTNFMMNPNNIAFLSNNTYGKLYVILNEVGSFGVNFNASSKKVYGLQAAAPAAKLAKIDGYKDTLRRSTDKDHKLSHQTTSNLQQRFFKAKSVVASQKTEQEIQPTPLPQMV